MNELIKELQDNLTVMAGIQARHSTLMREHSEWLAAHDRAMNDLRERSAATDQRIDRLVIAIGTLVTKLEGAK